MKRSLSAALAGSIGLCFFTEKIWHKLSFQKLLADVALDLRGEHNDPRHQHKHEHIEMEAQGDPAGAGPEHISGLRQSSSEGALRYFLASPPPRIANIP